MIQSYLFMVNNLIFADGILASFDIVVICALNLNDY
jgi:hypothetical protein